MAWRHHYLFIFQSTTSINKFIKLGFGDDQVVSMLAFYSDDPSSIPTEVSNILLELLSNENIQKESLE